MITGATPQHIVVSKEGMQFNLPELHLGNLHESISDSSNDMSAVGGVNNGNEYRKNHRKRES